MDEGKEEGMINKREKEIREKQKGEKKEKKREDVVRRKEVARIRKGTVEMTGKWK